MTLRILHAHTAVTAIAGLSLALTVVSGATAPPAEAAPGPITVVQHNVEKKATALRAALKQAHRSGAHAITLQEVCQRHLPAIRKYAKKIGRRWTVNPTTSRENGCGTEDDLMTVAVRTKGGATTFSHPLAPDQFPDGSHRRDQHLTCVRWGAPVRTVCSVHIALGGAVVAGNPRLKAGRTQIKQIKQITAGFIAQGQLVVVGGDFNAVPKDPVLNRMYAKGKDKKGRTANGRFLEAHQLKTRSVRRAGPWTAKNENNSTRKIDFVFFSANKTPWPQNGARSKPMKTPSDHRLLLTRAAVRR